VSAEQPPRATWSEIVEFELQQTHCKFCGDAIVREEDRTRFDRWPHEVVCPTCAPLAEAHLFDVATLEAEDVTFLQRLAMRAIAAFGAVVIAASVVVFLSIYVWR
jgi:hypothetical protein